MIKSFSARIVFAVALFSILFAGRLEAHNLVVNGGFETYTGVAPKNRFSLVQPTGWTIGSAPISDLAFVYAPGTASNGAQISVWPVFPHQSPALGNFVGIDGDTNYSAPISQTLVGLLPNQKYRVSFWEAAGQEVNFDGPTSEWWDVTLDGVTQSSTGFVLPSHGVGQWQKQNLFYTTSASPNPVLTFFSRGTPNGIPPVAFLDGVSVCAVPEPSSLAIVAIGLIGSIAVRRLRSSFAK